MSGGRPLVGLSSASVFPEPLESAFELAADLGYDGLELMVWTDPVSQQPERVRELSHKYGVPVLSVHAPCLLLTARVWGTEPGPKLQRAVRAARELGADTVVVHPPLAWQRRYAREFASGVRALEAESGVAIAVENMFPVYVGGRAISSFRPGWDVTEQPHRHLTLDTSHTSVSRSDALALAVAMGERLQHVHIADGSGKGSDEHLVPGRGDQRCDVVLEYLAATGFAGAIVVEVSTRSRTREQREGDLVEALAFVRRHARVA